MTRLKALKILLAVDGSVHSEAAANFVMQLAWPKAAFEVLAVAPERWQTFQLSGEAQLVLEQTANKVQRIEQASTKDIAYRIAAELGRHGPQTAAKVRVGRPSRAILQHAGEMRADLIIIGARGLSAPGEFRLGSTAHQLAYYAEQPVLIVRPPLLAQPLNVILAADGSPEAERAAEFLCRLALPKWAEITIVSVAEAETALPVGGYAAVLEVPAAVRQAMLEATEANALTAAAQLRGCAADLQHSLHVGRPAVEILSAAREHDANLIVLGARGHTRVPGSHLGGVAQKLVKYAPCSVLIVR